MPDDQYQAPGDMLNLAASFRRSKVFKHLSDQCLTGSNRGNGSGYHHFAVVQNDSEIGKPWARGIVDSTFHDSSSMF
ncbi:hypothetical protein A6E19_13215 [Pseudomonas putida]|nr:hypothetical protein A6E23_15310 [Pseudomonas putida]OCT27365.1 hypothetical protein A6E20_08270 [Pseudomonas putida]OCT28648.1 hypothetical protein A6E24_08085 [Pseudomonas putida]OCT38120.1 hypothetical protein A6E19_13215 [Pseudomonas putida]